MFTGIISELGTVASVEMANDVMRLIVAAPATASDASVGDSIAVNGVCLTAVGVNGPTFTVEIVLESLDRSALGSLDRGATVNLERPMIASGRFDGHVVQGHVDGVGSVQRIDQEGDARRLRIELPKNLSRYVVEKGSITVDGTSLTITAVSDIGADDSWFDVVVIPHTLAATTFGEFSVGSMVNLEVDVIAKYVERMVGGKP